MAGKTKKTGLFGARRRQLDAQMARMTGGQKKPKKKAKK